MNPYNNNGYEIIDSNTSPYPSNKNNQYFNSKYPYNTNPNQLYRENPESFVDTSIAVSAGMIVVGTIISPFTIGSIPGVILISMGTILSILFPENKNTVWKNFMLHGGSFFNQQFEEARAIQTLEGFKRVIDSYENSLKSWENLKIKHIPGSTPSAELRQAASLVKTRFEIVHNDFVRDMSEFQISPYQQLLLSSYTQAAVLHLNLLQQGSQLADRWNEDIYYNSQITFETDAGTSKGYNQLAKKYISEYSDYIIKTYDNGLKILRASSNMTWNIYNQYRREMTLIVLDLVANFSKFDIEYYSIPTKNELTREIYTKALGGTDRTDSLNEYEKELVRPPHLFTWLKTLTHSSNSNSIPFKYLAGITNHYINTNDLYYKTYSYGHNDGEKIALSFNYDIYKILITRNMQAFGSAFPPPMTYTNPDQIHKLNYYLSNANTTNYNPGGTPPNYTTQNEIKLPRDKNCNLNSDQQCSPDYNNYSHILSWFSMFIKSNVNVIPGTSHIYLFSWTHKSVDPNNRVFDSRISQIPAVKATTIGSSIVYAGPGHTGGDLIFLDSNADMNISYAYQGSAIQNFRIRIRYAADTNDTQMVIYGSNILLTVFKLEKTFTNSQNTELKYDNFKYVTIDQPIRILQPINNTIILRKNDLQNKIVFIDKIEFIPIN